MSEAANPGGTPPERRLNRLPLQWGLSCLSMGPRIKRPETIGFFALSWTIPANRRAGGQFRRPFRVHHQR